MGLFGEAKKPDMKEQVREWQKQLRLQMHGLDRQIFAIEREELKVKQSIKEAAKKGDLHVAKTLAKSLVQSKRAKSRLHTSKAQINSVCMQIQNQAAMLRVAGALEKSTTVMQAMSSLIKMPEIRDTMMALSREMTKAGLIEEVMDDTMENVFDEDGLEEEASAEVDKVLYEITKGVMGAAPDVNAPLPEVKAAEQGEAVGEDDLAARLQVLRS
jgi:charged multivesicular body protein 3